MTAHRPASPHLQADEAQRLSRLASDLEAASPIDALRIARGMRNDLESLEIDLVVLARQQSESWDRIAAALGTSRQSAWERYSKLI